MVLGFLIGEYMFYVFKSLFSLSSFIVFNVDFFNILLFLSILYLNSYFNALFLYFFQLIPDRKWNYNWLSLL